MANSIANFCARQEALSFVRKITLAEFLAAETANTLKIALPVNAIITSGSVTVLTASVVTGSDLLDVGYAGSLEAYKADISLEATATTQLVPTGYTHLATTSDLILTRTPAAADATSLEILVEFTYVVLGRVECTQD